MGTKVNPQLRRTFTGTRGKARLVDALTEQQLIAHDRQLTSRIAKKITLVEVPKGRELITQGTANRDLFFILAGACAIEVNGREVATRRANEHVGEIALLDTVALRSASVRATEQTVLARISPHDFVKIAKQYPDLWRRMAMMLGNRLRERNKFQQAPHEQPVIFIGSSSGGGLPIAKRIQKYLSELPTVPNLWTENVFQSSNTTIEDLVTASRDSDFAVLVLTADDLTTSRGQRKAAPRDNVIFELGLFIGALGRPRAYMVVSKAIDIKLPTDLLGVNYIPFHQKRGATLSANLKPVLQKIRKLIEKHGPM
jgi:CRP/FNR family cyclic AMP-dependent transcriptional regulator